MAAPSWTPSPPAVAISRMRSCYRAPPPCALSSRRAPSSPFFSLLCEPSSPLSADLSTSFNFSQRLVLAASSIESTRSDLGAAPFATPINWIDSLIVVSIPSHMRSACTHMYTHIYIYIKHIHGHFGVGDIIKTVRQRHRGGRSDVARAHAGVASRSTRGALRHADMSGVAESCSDFMKEGRVCGWGTS